MLLWQVTDVQLKFHSRKHAVTFTVLLLPCTDVAERANLHKVVCEHDLGFRVISQQWCACLCLVKGLADDMSNRAVGHCEIYQAHWCTGVSACKQIHLYQIWLQRLVHVFIFITSYYLQRIILHLQLWRQGCVPETSPTVQYLYEGMKELLGVRTFFSLFEVFLFRHSFNCGCACYGMLSCCLWSWWISQGCKRVAVSLEEKINRSGLASLRIE